MEAIAFCPAHVTGFFKAHFDNNNENPENFGSMGAGFSINEGVTTKVIISKTTNNQEKFRITTKGFQSDKTDVSEFVLDEFLKLGNFDEFFFDIEHKIDDNGNPIISNCKAVINCNKYDILDGGDHSIIIGKVEHFSIDSDTPPLIYYKGGYSKIRD